MNSTLKNFLFFYITLFNCFFARATLADAKVDGFFREKLISDGFFEEYPDLNKKVNSKFGESQDFAKENRFFISREERRRNPEAAPSNNIKLPQESVRVRTRTIGLPNGWTSSVYGIEAVTSGN